MQKLLPATRPELIVVSKLQIPVMVTNVAGKTLWINQAFSEMCGYTLEELKGKSPGSVLQGAFTDVSTRERIRDAVRERRGVEEEILNYTKEGNPYWVSLQITPVFDDHGELLYFISFAKNVTKQKEVERGMVRFLAKSAHLKIPEGWITKCAWTEKVMREDGQFISVEEWLERYTETRLTHGLSPTAATQMKTKIQRKRKKPSGKGSKLKAAAKVSRSSKARAAFEVEIRSDERRRRARSVRGDKRRLLFQNLSLTQILQ